MDHEAGCQKIWQFHLTPMNQIFDPLWWLDWRGHRKVLQRFKIETWEMVRLTVWTLRSVWLFDTWLKILEMSIYKTKLTPECEFRTWKSPDVADKIGAISDECFWIQYAYSNFIRYDQYLDESLKIEIGNFLSLVSTCKRFG